MASPLRFRTFHLLAAMTYLSVAGLLWSYRREIEPLIWPIIGIAGGLVFLLAPFAAIGAMVDRPIVGILCGLGAFAALLLFRLAL